MKKTVRHADSIFHSLRRITHALAQHNRQLNNRFNLTVPQVLCLRQLFDVGPATIGELAKKFYFSQATITGIVDRLESRGLVQRDRNDFDRRRVIVSLTDKGNGLADDMPGPLQERFATELQALNEEERDRIDMVLKQLVEMMEGKKDT